MTERLFNCDREPCRHAPGTCNRGAPPNQPTRMDEHELLAYALFNLDGKRAWSAAPERMKGYYYGQATKLERMLASHNHQTVYVAGLASSLVHKPK